MYDIDIEDLVVTRMGLYLVEVVTSILLAVVVVVLMLVVGARLQY